MKLVLRPRREDDNGIPRWHDSLRLQAVLDTIGANKPVSQCGIWFGIARKVRIAQIEAGYPTQVNVEIEIELKNGEAKELWEHLQRAPAASFRKNPFTGQPEPPDLATLGEMLEDWGEQLQVS